VRFRFGCGYAAFVIFCENLAVFVPSVPFCGYSFFLRSFPGSDSLGPFPEIPSSFDDKSDGAGKGGDTDQ
jgi:hypothetical protein